MGGGPESTARGRVRPRSYARPWVVVLFVLLSLGLGLLARRSPMEGIGFQHLWPVGGLPIVWLLVRGARLVSIDTVLVAVVAVLGNLAAGADPDLAAVFGGAALIQSWIAVLLIRRWCPDTWGCGGERPLDRPRTVAGIGSALVIAMVLGTGLIAASAALLPDVVVDGLDPWSLGLWCGRNLCSTMVVVGLVLTVGQRLSLPRPRPRPAGDGGAVELVAALAFTGGMYVLAFAFDGLPLAFPPLVATVWIGLRFSTPLSAAHSFVLGVVVVGLTSQDIGPFAAVDDSALGHLLAQLYVATIAVTGLTLGTARDERAALAGELARTREKAEYEAQMRAAVIGSMTEGVMVVDDTGALLVQNDAAARVFGLTPPLSVCPALTLSCSTLDGQPLTEKDKPTTRALRGETLYDEQLVVQLEDGDHVFSVSAVPLPRTDAGERARALILLRDTTAEHARRTELAAFAGVVAHDLRNPLAAIDGWTEMIADELDAGGLDAQLAREFVSRVRSASRRMRELIRDLLAHATSAQRDLEVTKVEIRALVEEIAAGRHAEGWVTAEPCPAVLADPVLARQVLDNLIGNAIKYVAPGEEPKIVVRGTRTDARWVTVQVVDNGIGVPESDRERIFEEFHRAHYREYEGSGLGLSIVRRIVTRHGGRIVALPNPDGHGSVFEFTLPAYEAD